MKFDPKYNSITQDIEDCCTELVLIKNEAESLLGDAGVKYSDINKFNNINRFSFKYNYQKSLYSEVNARDEYPTGYVSWYSDICENEARLCELSTGAFLLELNKALDYSQNVDFVKHYINTQLEILEKCGYGADVRIIEQELNEFSSKPKIYDIVDADQQISDYNDVISRINKLNDESKKCETAYAGNSYENNKNVVAV